MTVKQKKVVTYRPRESDEPGVVLLDKYEIEEGGGEKHLGTYRITEGGKKCSCPGFEFRKECRHIGLDVVKEFLGRVPARPSAEPEKDSLRTNAGTPEQVAVGVSAPAPAQTQVSGLRKIKTFIDECIKDCGIKEMSLVTMNADASVAILRVKGASFLQGKRVCVIAWEGLEIVLVRED